ncbi:helix-turn-helix domain-containing protein [Nonomuraea polychroma]|uniref:helix-turn-helix domain-containing protein n=1 Tax=Nonomuraea polychroma TaxID=46176 RepID=UPI000FDE1055|nr:helix-turn-helix domain-containing protein [Nonomuraea polychroma]
MTEIVHDCHLPASAARRLLQSLVELGLATRSTGRPVRYVAVSPPAQPGVKYRVVYDTGVLELAGWVEDVTAGMRHGGRPGSPPTCR